MASVCVWHPVQAEVVAPTGLTSADGFVTALYPLEAGVAEAAAIDVIGRTDSLPFT
jgi:hypothetical protein